MLRIPLHCTRGPADQERRVAIAVPAAARTGALYRVRVEGTDSGPISHFGLNYIYDMTDEWLVPAGARYVEGSARVVPGTGSENVRPGARAFHQGNAIVMAMPARVDSGSSYTPPSFEFVLQATALPGATILQTFDRFTVKANAFLVGDIAAVCEPSPRPFPVAVTKVDTGDGS
jgi:hypothetical protein